MPRFRRLEYDPHYEGPQTEQEAAAEMEGFEEAAERSRQIRERQQAKARAEAERRLGRPPSAEELAREFEWVRATEWATGRPSMNHHMLTLPVEYRPQKTSFWTDDNPEDGLRNFVEVRYDGRVGRGPRTDREEALRLVAGRTGAPLDLLRELLIHDHPASERWLKD